MGKTSVLRKTGMGGGIAALFMLLPAVAAAQETLDQFDAANAEARRHSEAQNDLNDQAHDLRIDQNKALLTCQGAASAAAAKACAGNVEIEMRQKRLDLDNQAIRERNNHTQILKGIGVHRVP